MMKKAKSLVLVVITSLLMLASNHGIVVLSKPLNIDQPDDPLYPVQWALSKIQAFEAWTIEAGDPSVIIAVIDTGVNYSLPDLENAIWVNPGEDLNQNSIVDEEDFNGVDDDGNGYIDDMRGWDFYENDNDPMDDEEHGTILASIVASTTNNGIGVAGVSQCSIMPLRYQSIEMEWTDEQGNYSEAIIYAVDNGAKVIVTASGYVENNSTINAFYYAHSRGVLLVEAAGNGGYNIDKVFRRPWYDPVHWDFIMIVTGSNVHDNRTGGSNWGPSVDISAPKFFHFALPNGTYFYGGGTSISAPIVAGVAGLLYSQNPDWSDVEVTNRIKETADPIDHLNPGYEGMLGAGRINALRALGGEPVSDTAPPELDELPDYYHIIGVSDDILTWNASDENPYWFEVYRNKTDVTPGTMVRVYGGLEWALGLWDGSPIEMNISDLEPGVYVFECRVCDLNENVAVDIVRVEVLTLEMFENMPAEFEVSELDVSPEAGFDIPFETGDYVIITVLVKNIDEKEGSFIVEWKINGETIEMQNVSLAAGRGRHARAYFEAQSPGSYQVSVGDLRETFIVSAPLEPAVFEFSSFRIFYPGEIPLEVEAGQAVTVSVSVEVENVGELEGDVTVELIVDKEVVDSTEVTLGGGASETVLFELTRGEGLYEVEVEGFTESFTINARPEPEKKGIPGYPYLAIFLGLVFALLSLCKIQI
jgi:hypothetical protein